MLTHFDVGGRCSGKLIRQSRGRKTSKAVYVCNLCDMLIGEDTAKRLAHRKKVEQRRKRHAEPK